MEKKMINKIERGCEEGKWPVLRIMAERKRMQLRDAVEMGNNEFKPRFCPCAPGGLPCGRTIQGVGRKVKIIPACKRNLEAMTYFNLPSPHS